MKIIYFTVFIALFLIQSTYSQTSKLYYWYSNQKISLETDSSKIFAIVKHNNGSIEKFESDLEQEQGVLKTESSIYQAVTLIIDEDKEKRERLLKIIEDKYPDLCFNFYVKSDGVSHAVTNTIILRPKGDIEQVKKQFSNRITFVSSTKYNTFLFEVSSNYSALDIANQVYESGLVDWSEPNFISPVVQTNTLYSQQYYLNNTGQTGGTSGVDIDAPEAWAISQGCAIRVAVLDDGVENHEDLAGRVVAGFDAVNPTNPGAPLATTEGHGQACAGIIAASNNTIGIRGIASNAIIVPVRILGAGYDNNQRAAAINWAWDDGAAAVLSNSWVGGSYSSIVTTAINNALTEGRGGKGSVVVFASGNYGTYSNYSVRYPADIDGVVTVGAVNKNGLIWDYTSYGPSMDVVAPSGQRGNNAGDVTTIDRMNANGFYSGNYQSTFGGTSAAAPQVAGVVALMLSVNPNLTYSQVTSILQQTATDGGPAGFDDKYGHGRLNAFRALQKAIGGPISGPNHICPNATYSLTALPSGATVSWSSSNTGAVTINSSGVATRVGSFNGSVTITATVNTGGCSGVQLKKIVTVGTPNLVKTVNGSLITGPYPVSPGGTYTLNTSSNSTSATFNYNNYSGTGNMTISLYNPSNPSTPMYVNGSSTVGSRYVRVTGTNTCGSYYEDFVFYIPGGMLKAYPNPAKDILVIEFSSSESTNLPNEISLISEKTGSIVRAISPQEFYRNGNFEDGNKIKLDVSTYPRGIYYLHIKPDATESKQTIEKIRIVLE